MIEIGIGHYPYPPETYSNVFAQLTAIVHGEPPELPEDRYSEMARDFVSRCMVRAPEKRASYAELLVSIRSPNGWNPFLISFSFCHTPSTGASFSDAMFEEEGRHVCMGAACASIRHTSTATKLGIIKWGFHDRDIDSVLTQTSRCDN
jgi:serine/threonine protein kinase